MQYRATVMLIASDAALIRDAAIVLSGAEYHVVTEASIDAPPPDIILRHFETRMQPPSGSIPVLTLDLSQVKGAGLVDVVGRGLGRAAARREAAVDYLVAMFRTGAVAPAWRTRRTH